MKVSAELVSAKDYEREFVSGLSPWLANGHLLSVFISFSL